MDQILQAILNGASGEELAAIPLPTTYRAAFVRKEDQNMWDGIPSEQKDPRKSLHIGEVPLPEIAPDEVVVAVMASSINFNTVWTSIFEPISTFGALARLGRESSWAKRHDLDYHVVGSDGSGVVLRVGSAVRNWKPGDKITIHCNHVDDQDPSSHSDSMMGSNQRIWGYETNFGGLADLAVVKANQLMPKPAHLTWEEAAVNALCNSTSYREDPDIVFEHPGRSTFAASIYVVKKGGTVVTCAATSGFMMEFDNRHFWMRLKKLVGSHFANYKESYEANRLIAKGMIHPVMSQVFTLDQVGEASYQVHNNMHEGKLGVLCLAPEEGLGVDDHELRAKVGEKLNWFRR